MWCIPPTASAAFVCAMEDILEIYKRPYNPEEPLVCMDEMAKQLVNEIRLPIAGKAGRIARFDYEYERNGVCNLFMFYEPFGAKRYTAITERRTKVDWAYQIKELLDLHYPDVKKVVLVMDNLNTHSGASLYEAFSPHEARRLLERLEIHYTPKHGSWLNVAEIELRVLMSQCLNRRIPDKKTLEHETRQWENQRNFIKAKVNWQFTVDDARIKLKRLYPTLLT
jgi:transposase